MMGTEMGFISKLVAKIVLNGVALWAAGQYFEGFVLGGGFETLIVAALVITGLYVFIRPIVKLVATPLVWITFGLFTIVINVALLWVADYYLAELAISNLSTLFWVSIMLSVVNAFF